MGEQLDRRVKDLKGHFLVPFSRHNGPLPEIEIKLTTI